MASRSMHIMNPCAFGGKLKLAPRNMVTIWSAALACLASGGPFLLGQQAKSARTAMVAS